MKPNFTKNSPERSISDPKLFEKFKVIKRDGKTEKFDFRKIEDVVHTCLINSECQESISCYQDIIKKIHDKLVEEKEETFKIDHIQGMIKNNLFELGFQKSFTDFIIYEHERKKIREDVIVMEKRNKSLSSKKTLARYLGEELKRNKIYQ
jgi:transcriptional regulator NrdR family protein